MNLTIKIMDCFVGKLLYWYGMICAGAFVISLLFACWMWIDYKWNEFKEIKRKYDDFD